MATVSAISAPKIAGGSFLIEERRPEEIFTPEDFSEQHLLIAQTTEEFATKEVVPNIDKIEHKDFGITRELLKKAGELGLSGVDVPEEYGGMQMDKVTSAIIADRLAKYGGFSTTWGAHTCIGTLPIVYFGTEAQKKKYLPGLATGTTVGAYALSESSSASDALNCRARAELSPDGKYYVLNGEKMWITNAGFADLFIVFAKVNGEKFTAFIIERTAPGLSVGAEEHKMGIRGSSTCPLLLNDCKVPAENVLGEIGKGHTIAFNVLNVGRFKLGAACIGSARNCLESAIGYAKQRKAFGKVIADFGLIREKLANMATGIFTGEAMAYRTVGMLDEAVAQLPNHHDMVAVRKLIDEYVVECSILKVWGSEFINYVVDEMVQIYAGYGFVEEYPAERAYRDSRINRIFEGTNEINRLVITGFLLKRAMSGQLPLMPAIKQLMDEVLSGSKGEMPEGALAEERKLVADAKKLGLFAAGVATQKYMQAIQDQQEIMGAIANMTMETYAMESAVLRAQKLAERNGEAACNLPIAMTRVYLAGAFEKVESAAKMVIAAASDGDMLRSQMAILRRLCKYEPFNTVALRQQIAQKIIETGKYVIA
ncbi:MAG TPA: acyl-CoA dehydrogenase family protein [Terriglobales bacterium]|nr:acyl-CoA dehydrogenase family protein [Terriglobales bacterium]